MHGETVKFIGSVYLLIMIDTLFP